MRAGDRDRRISLARLIESRGPDNEPISNWAVIATVWASWRRATANERLAALQVSAQVTDIFEVRWSNLWANLNPKDRLTYKRMTFDVIEVTEIGRRAGLLIRASARADQVPAP